MVDPSMSHLHLLCGKFNRHRECPGCACSCHRVKQAEAEAGVADQVPEHLDPVALLEKAMRLTMQIECTCARDDDLEGLCNGECVGSQVWLLVYRARKLVRAQREVDSSQELKKALRAAVSAMRSYQCGNASGDLADEVEKYVREIDL